MKVRTLKLRRVVVAALAAAMIGGTAALPSSSVALAASQRSSVVRPPAGCTVKATAPEVRRGQMAGIGLLTCNHRQRVTFTFALLQRRGGTRWKVVGVGATGSFVMLANRDFHLMSNPVRCRKGFYRSKIGVGFPGSGNRDVERWSKGKTLNCG